MVLESAPNVKYLSNAKKRPANCTLKKSTADAVFLCQFVSKFVSEADNAQREEAFVSLGFVVPLLNFTVRTSWLEPASKCDVRWKHEHVSQVQSEREVEAIM